MSRELFLRLNMSRTLFSARSRKQAFIYHIIGQGRSLGQVWSQFLYWGILVVPSHIPRRAVRTTAIQTGKNSYGKTVTTDRERNGNPDLHHGLLSFSGPLASSVSQWCSGRVVASPDRKRLGQDC
jgi:hypothetical protein